MIVSFALSHLIARCAPKVGGVTMSAIVTYESRANPNAIGDNTTHNSYAPVGQSQAVRIASRLIALGHNIDAGYMQVNSANFRTFGLTSKTVFDPCTNLAAGARILQDDYVSAARIYGPGQLALFHALSAYNTGGFLRGLRYARRVYAVASHLRSLGSKR